MFNSTLFPLENAEMKMSSFLLRLITRLNFSLLNRTRNSLRRNGKIKERNKKHPSQPVLHQREIGRQDILLCLFPNGQNSAGASSSLTESHRGGRSRGDETCVGRPLAESGRAAAAQGNPARNGGTTGFPFPELLVGRKILEATRQG